MKKFISVILILLITLSTAVFARSGEGDMQSLLAELKIMQGDPSGDFRPGDSVSRAEFSKVAVAASPFKDSVASGSSVSPFKDVPAAHWAAPYIQLAVQSGYVKGYMDATFRPDSTVAFEEAVTVFLKILGYIDEDFGSSWPYGQVGTAKRIGLCDGVEREIGDSLTRRDVMLMSYNLLNTEPKGASVDYINALNYSIIEDVILVATAREDSSVGSDKVSTTAGTFKLPGTFNLDAIGKKGDLIIKNGDEAVAFIPNEQRVSTYSIYQVLGNEVVVMENNSMQSLSLDKNLSIFNKSARTTLSAMLSAISAGDVLVTYTNAIGVIDYGILKTDQLQGPFTYTGGGHAGGFDLAAASVTRNGKPASSSGLEANDIVYYSPQLNTVWAYSTRVTGVYEKAEPNKDTPTSVQISGVSYTLESAAAFNKLSSSGTLEYGDTITVMLGKSNQIADVFTSLPTSSVYGYLLSAGTKEFTAADQQKYVNNSINVVLTDGKTYEYTSDKDYSKLVNSAVSITFADGKAAVSAVRTQSAVSGLFAWSAKTLGGQKLAADVNILDAYVRDEKGVGAYAVIYPQRLDRLTIPQNSILFTNKNSAGEISDIILNNYTGDAYSYGIMKNAVNSSSPMVLSVAGQYEYVIGGAVKFSAVSGKTFSILSGQPAKFILSPAGIDSVSALTRIDGKVTSEENNNVIIGGVKYPLSDKAEVYKTDSSFNYTIIPLSEALASKLTLTAYCDKAAKDGGLVRIIVGQ